MKQFIPYTEERQQRLFPRYLQTLASEGDGVALVQWEDGSITPKTVEWNSEESALVTEDDARYYARGLGSEPKQLAGVPVWYVYAGEAGIISTEACLIADAEHYDEVVDVGAGEQVPDELRAAGVKDPNAESVATDGSGLPFVNGADQETDDDAAEVSEDAAVYDLRSPDGYDGVTIDVRMPYFYDPFPVRESDARESVKMAEIGGQDQREKLKWLVTGAGIVVAVWLAFTIIPWLLGQIGGSVSSGGSTTSVMLGGVWRLVTATTLGVV